MSMISDLVDGVNSLRQQKLEAKAVSKQLLESVKKYGESRDSVSAKAIAEFTMKRKEIQKTITSKEEEVFNLANSIQVQGFENCLKGN